MIYDEWKDYLNAANHWLNQLEEMINELNRNERMSILCSNIVQLREEMQKKDKQDKAFIIKLMDEVKRDYDILNQRISPRKTGTSMGESICNQFADALHGPGKFSDNVCSVELTRDFNVTIMGKDASSALEANVSFESLDQEGNALNMSEITILEDEVAPFTRALAQQGLTVTALHNHWIYSDPVILYIHILSVEPPIKFAKKMAKAFTALQSYPVTSG